MVILGRTTAVFSCQGRRLVVESCPMIGTIINAAAIVTGGIVGLTISRNISPVNQSRLNIALGAFTVYAGLSTALAGFSGSFWQRVAQLGIAVLSMMAG